MFAVRELSLSVVGAIYRTADATSCFILPVWEDSVALRTPSNVGDPPEGGFPAVEGVESEQDLMKRLNTAFGGWSVYRGQVVGKGETKGERVSLFERMFGRKDRKSK